MHPNIRAILAVVAGVIIGVTIMNGIQSFSPYQPPPGVTYISGEPPYLEWVRSLNTSAWTIIIVSMLTGSLIGAFVTNKITPPTNFPPLITGFTILFFAIVRYMAFASPAWATYVSCVGCLLFAWIGGWLATRIKIGKY